MKKFLIFLLLISSSTIADIKYSFTDYCYYTDPATPDINQAEYDLLMTLVTIMNWEMINTTTLQQDRWAVIDAFLMQQQTPTADRLLADLRKIRL